MIKFLQDAAGKGELDPWDIDVISVIDSFLEQYSHTFNQSSNNQISYHRDLAEKSEEFFAWNGGDAVGQFYYQFLHNNKTSFGINAGIRSVYSGSGPGGTSDIGKGQSFGFRIDRKISAK